MVSMNVTIDKAGRLVLPKKVREQLQVGPGDGLELIGGSHEIVLRPVRKQAPLRKKRGIWVLAANGPSITLEEVNRALDKVREGRIQDNSGVIK